MLFRIFSCAVVIALLLAAPIAGAADNGFYLGASVGKSDLAIDDFGGEGFDFEGDDTGFKAFFGFRFLTFLAAEASYVDFGSFNDSSAEGDGSTVEADLKGYDLFAVGMLPLGLADIFAKVGVVSWDSDIRAAIEDATASESGTDPVYGIGVQLRFKSFAARAEFEYFDVRDVSGLYMISLGASYTF